MTQWTTLPRKRLRSRLTSLLPHRTPLYSSITCLIFEEIDITQKAKIPLTPHPHVVVFCFLFFFFAFLAFLIFTHTLFALYMLPPGEKDERLFAALKRLFICLRKFSSIHRRVSSTFYVEIRDKSCPSIEFTLFSHFRSSTSCSLSRLLKFG